MDLAGLEKCRKCPRLATFREGLRPRRGLQRTDYWGRPVPGFGDPQAKIFLLGLAPGAHGANRTGRPFTGDGAGDFMYPLLFEAGLSNHPGSGEADDGLRLKGLYISNAVKCVPPQNRPLSAEFRNCRNFLKQELERFSRLRVVLALGRDAHYAYLKLLRAAGKLEGLSDFPFGHGALCRPGNDIWLLTSYHTSRYNVQTGRLTSSMFVELLEQAKALAAGQNG